MIPSHARAVVFDAVGTVLFPEPGVAQVYGDAATRFGLRSDPDVILSRFREAFAHEERVDAAAGWVTSEARELERWKAIVAASLPGASAACFDHLYAHFAKPDAWRVPDDAAAVFDALHARGLRLGMASNLDTRLTAIVAGRPEVARLADRVVVSSLVGVRKPGRGFFDAVIETMCCRADEIVHVGDDPDNDFAGATAAGLHAILLDPHDRHPHVTPRIRRLADLTAR